MDRTLSELRPTHSTERIFRPNYLSFAGTYQCNLTCPHCCVPIEWTDRLDIPVALRFLEECHQLGIRILGFTGGEPFLYPDFLVQITARASDLGFKFDKIMTNGLWYKDVGDLERSLRDLADAGFSGKIGLSVDKFHGMDLGRLAEFCRTVRGVFGRDNILSISYASRHPDQGLEPVHRLARELEAVVEWSKLLRRYLLVGLDFTMTLNWNHLAPVERAEGLAGGWDGHWFEEDYCEGPGQAFIVNPRGEVKPCCGFASDLDQLSLGNIYRQSAKEILHAGRSHPYVGKVFREGLLAIRDEVLARDPTALPQATSNHCFFCWWVLTRNLTEPSGRISLPLVPEHSTSRLGAKTSHLVMAFDGRTVFLVGESDELPLPGKGRSYQIDIVGPTPVEPPTPGQLSWTKYQAWIDGLRDRGFTLTTRDRLNIAARETDASHDRYDEGK